MSQRLLLDEDVPPAVAVGLRARGVDVVSVYELGRAGQRISDEEQLLAATAAGRVLVTYNRADYQMLDGQWRRTGRQHAGMRWCSERSLPRRAIGLVIAALAAVAAGPSVAGLCLPVPRPATPDS